MARSGLFICQQESSPCHMVALRNYFLLNIIMAIKCSYKLWQNICCSDLCWLLCVKSSPLGVAVCAGHCYIPAVLSALEQFRYSTRLFFLILSLILLFKSWCWTLRILSHLELMFFYSLSSSHSFNGLLVMWLQLLVQLIKMLYSFMCWLLSGSKFLRLQQKL